MLKGQTQEKTRTLLSPATLKVVLEPCLEGHCSRISKITAGNKNNLSWGFPKGGFCEGGRSQ